MQVPLPDNAEGISAVALGQHLESQQIKRHFLKKAGLDAGELLEAGHLRTVWRELQALESANFAKLVRAAFDMADVDGDEKIS